MSSNLKVNNILPSTGDTVAVTGIASVTSSVSIASSCTATTFYGSGANLTGITGTTINNNAANRVITGEGGTTLNGESNFTFDGSTATITASSGYSLIANGSSTGIGLGSNGVIVFGNQNIAAYGPGVFDATQYQFKTSATERLRITSAGQLLVGTSSASNRFKNGNGNGATPKFQFETANVDEQNDISLTFGRNNAFGAEIILAKHRAATVGGYTVVQSGDRLGGINFAGSDGAHFRPAALIQSRVDGTPGTADMPGRLEFHTTADGAATPTERLRITSSGSMGLGTNNPNDTLHVYHATDNLVARFESGDTGGGITLKDNTHVTSLLTTNGAFEINVDQGGDISGETISFKMSGTEKLRILSSGGITFNGDTATANALDDYEEGTWTPNIRNDGTTANWTSQTGKYVKIGQQVTVWFNADGGSDPRSGGSSSSLIMTGLPFSQSMISNPILGIVGANKSSGTGLYSTAGLILNAFGQSGTQVRFGCGGQPINFSISYVSGCLTYTTAS